MSKTTRPILARLREILRRQDPPGWGKNYIPAILAERAEAPGRSRPARVWSPKFQRDLHVLSSVELQVLLVALYHPHLFELHEQRMLAMEPRPHPLVGHPAVTDEALPSLRGTIAVAGLLDSVHLHPWIKFRDENRAQVTAPFPWVGDFLLFLIDDLGPYCINWTVKRAADDFDRSGKHSRPSRDPAKESIKAKTRHAIEELYYRDADIRTVRIVESDVPKKLSANLRRLYSSFCHEVVIDNDTRARVIDRLQGCLLTDKPPLETFLSLQAQVDLDVIVLKTLMEQAIWQRELRVDLFGAPIFPDCPLPPEKTNLLETFAHWFKRGGA